MEMPYLQLRASCLCQPQASLPLIYSLCTRNHWSAFTRSFPRKLFRTSFQPIPLHHPHPPFTSCHAGDAYFLHGQDLALQALQLASLPQAPPTSSPPTGQSAGVNGASPSTPADGSALSPAVAADEAQASQASPNLPAVRWASAYYLPANADRLIVAFRQWLDKYAGMLRNSESEIRSPKFGVRIESATGDCVFYLRVLMCVRVSSLFHGIEARLSPRPALDLTYAVSAFMHMLDLSCEEQCLVGKTL